MATLLEISTPRQAQAPRPPPIAPSPGVHAIHRILVCVDRSPSSESCVSHALAISKSLGSAVTLLQVVEPLHERSGLHTTDVLDWEIARQEASAHLERDKALFAYARITAPFDGVVTQRYANLGALIQAGTGSPTATPLVRLSEDDVFRLVIPVAESYVKYIKFGDPVQVHVTSLDRNFTGTVKRFSNDVSSDTRTMHTEVELLNPGHVLMPGLYAEATLTLDRKNDALVLPLQAVSQTNGQVTVFVVNANNTIEERKIEAGLQTADDIEILSGLNMGDRVVVSDRSSLKNGIQVSPQQMDVEQYKATQQ